MQAGHTFSVEEYACNCYKQAELDPDCPHPTQKREAYVDELTDAQLRFMFLAEQERERMKQEKADSNTSGGPTGGASSPPSSPGSMSSSPSNF